MNKKNISIIAIVIAILVVWQVAANIHNAKIEDIDEIETEEAATPTPSLPEPDEEEEEEIPELAPPQDPEEIEQEYQDDLEEQETKANCEYVDLEDLNRYFDDYYGVSICIKATVNTVIDTDNWYYVMVYNSDYSFSAGIKISKAEYDGPRILTGDEVTAYGYGDGSEFFTNAMGSELEIPILRAEYVDIENI